MMLLGALGVWGAVVGMVLWQRARRPPEPNVPKHDHEARAMTEALLGAFAGDVDGFGRAKQQLASAGTSRLELLAAIDRLLAHHREPARDVDVYRAAGTTSALVNRAAAHWPALAGSWSNDTMHYERNYLDIKIL